MGILRLLCLCWNLKDFALSCIGIGYRSTSAFSSRKHPIHNVGRRDEQTAVLGASQVRPNNMLIVRASTMGLVLAFAPVDCCPFDCLPRFLCVWGVAVDWLFCEVHAHNLSGWASVLFRPVAAAVSRCWRVRYRILPLYSPLNPPEFGNCTTTDKSRTPPTHVDICKKFIPRWPSAGEQTE